MKLHSLLHCKLKSSYHFYDSWLKQKWGVITSSYNSLYCYVLLHFGPFKMKYSSYFDSYYINQQ